MSNQYGFYFDSSRCIKCWACEVACKQWNGIQAGGIARRKVIETTVGVFPNANRVFFSKACNHCENPSCVANCPVGAITKREEDGIVVVNQEICIGCQTCSLVCPFGVPEYEAESGKMNKCDGCVTCGLTPEDKPHCAATCPTKALQYGTLEEMEAEAAKKGGVRLEGDTNPSCFVFEV